MKEKHTMQGTKEMKKTTENGMKMEMKEAMRGNDLSFAQSLLSMNTGKKEQ